MSEPFDVYADAFTVSVTPWGSNLSFGLRPAHPAPGANPQHETLGVVRMSNEHMKVMVFMLNRQMANYEKTVGVQCSVPTPVLAALGISNQEWEEFWNSRGE